MYFYMTYEGWWLILIINLIGEVPRTLVNHSSECVYETFSTLFLLSFSEAPSVSQKSTVFCHISNFSSLSGISSLHLSYCFPYKICVFTWQYPQVNRKKLSCWGLGILWRLNSLEIKSLQFNILSLIYFSSSYTRNSSIMWREV
jgi:hypothetical protein